MSRLIIFISYATTDQYRSLYGKNIASTSLALSIHPLPSLWMILHRCHLSLCQLPWFVLAIVEKSKTWSSSRLDLDGTFLTTKHHLYVRIHQSIPTHYVHSIRGASGASTACWTGVYLRDVINRFGGGLKDNAKYICFEGVDKTSKVIFS